MLSVISSWMRLPCAALPGHLLLRSSAKHQQAQLADESGAFANRNEQVWSHQATLGMAPARQGLGTDRTARERVHDRLVVHLELMTLERQPQFSFQHRSGAQRIAHAGVIKRQIVAAPVLGGVHRQVRVAQQRFDVLAVLRIKAHPHAGRHAHALPMDEDRLCHRAYQAVAHEVDLLADVMRHQQDQEFIAAQTRHQVAATHRPAQPARHLHQQGVTGGMAQGVVDVLEVIQVDEHQRRLQPGAADAVNRFREAVHHLVAVGQAGQ
jgi:hypothetical protein